MNRIARAAISLPGIKQTYGYFKGRRVSQGPVNGVYFNLAMNKTHLPKKYSTNENLEIINNTRQTNSKLIDEALTELNPLSNSQYSTKGSKTKDGSDPSSGALNEAYAIIRRDAPASEYDVDLSGSDEDIVNRLVGEPESQEPDTESVEDVLSKAQAAIGLNSDGGKDDDALLKSFRQAIAALESRAS